MTLNAKLVDRSWFPPDSFVCSVRRPEERQAVPKTRTAGPNQAVGPGMVDKFAAICPANKSFGRSWMGLQIFPAANDRRAAIAL